MIGPGGTINLSATSLHLRCNDLSDSLEIGDNFSIELTIDGVGVLLSTVTIEGE